VLGLLDNKKFPAALVALAAGIISGFALGGFNAEALSIGPTRMQVIFPSLPDFWTAFIMLILPQIPLTIGNACVGTADTCCTLFPQSSSLSKSKAGKFALTMGIANFPAGFFGAVPMCHGTGGLAAHYRFGARTGGAPVMIGGNCIDQHILAYSNADYWARDAIQGIRICNQVLGKGCALP